MKIAVSSDMVPYLCTRADKMTELNDIRTALRKISAAGYEGVMADISLIKLPAEQLKECLDEYSLEMAGLLVKDVREIMEKESLDLLLESSRILGCANICIDGLDGEYLINEEKLAMMCQSLEEAAKVAEEKGAVLSQRPCAAAFIRRNGRPVIEEILEQTKKLMLEWNTYDMAVGGLYIPEWLEKTEERTVGIQFEDYQIDEESDTTFLECTHHIPAPALGKGSLNWERILAKSQKTDTGWCCITSRQPGRPVYGAVQESIHYLKEQMRA